MDKNKSIDSGISKKIMTTRVSTDITQMMKSPKDILYKKYLPKKYAIENFTTVHILDQART